MRATVSSSSPGRTGFETSAPSAKSGTRAAGALWSIVLAGGKGKRLAPLIERIHADGRPKQFAVLTGSRSLLRQTLDRAALAIAPERTVVIATRSQEPYLAAEFAHERSPEVLLQPEDRGTAAGILYPVHWIAARDPNATIAIFPSDHFVADDGMFMRHVLRLAALAPRDPERIFLLGARPDSPETGYGWIEPGSSLVAPDVRRVVRFWEKPSPQTARACLYRGCVWNTFVMVGRAEAFLNAAREATPSLAGDFARIQPDADPRLRERTLADVYALTPFAGFSDTILAASPARLAVSAMPTSIWSDWGTPERVLQTLRSRGITPAWLDRPARAAQAERSAEECEGASRAASSASSLSNEMGLAK